MKSGGIGSLEVFNLGTRIMMTYRWLKMTDCSKLSRTGTPRRLSTAAGLDDKFRYWPK